MNVHRRREGATAKHLLAFAERVFQLLAMG